MKLTSLRMGLAVLLAVGACALSAPGTQAQGFGGGQMPPEIQAKIKAWQHWREAHKHVSNLQMMLMQLREVDKEPGTQLTKAQAGKILPVMQSWRHKPTMSEDQAEQVSRQISSVLTDKQLKKMATIQPFRMRGGGPGGGRPGGGGPGGRPGGGMGSFPDPPAGGYNPLNPDTSPMAQFRPQMKKGLDDFMADLQKRAKG